MNMCVPLREYTTLDTWSHDVEKYIYAIEVEREDGEVFYYVGETTDMYTRMRTHRYRGATMSIPTTDGVLERTDVQDDSRFEIVGLERLVPVPDTTEPERRNKERETAYQVAIDHETTNVIGGH